MVNVTLPFEVGETTYNDFVANGSTVVTFTSLPGNHGGAVGPYIEDIAQKIVDYEK